MPTRLYENSFMYILKSSQQSCEVRVLSLSTDKLKEFPEIICTRRNGEGRIQIQVCWLPQPTLMTTRLYCLPLLTTEHEAGSETPPTAAQLVKKESL